MNAAPRADFVSTARARILEICTYPPPRAGWSMRVELLKIKLEAEGHDCVVLNTGRNRLVPSPHYETVLSHWDFVRKVWRFSRAGYVVHEHVNGDSAKGFVRTLLAEILNLLAGHRCYLTFHAGVEQVFFPRQKAPMLFPVYWLMFTIPKRIVCNSAAVKTKIIEFGIHPDKVVPIPAFTRQYLEYTRATLAPEVESLFDEFVHVIFTYVRVRPGFNLPTLIDGFAILSKARPDVGLLLVGVTDDIDGAIWSDVQSRIAAHGLEARIRIVDEFDHDEFLTVLTRCSCYLRTPTTDGVASSVLEALALGVPTVAAENGTRPPGVITYKGHDPDDLAARLEFTLSDLKRLAATLPRPEISDTLTEEVRLLSGAAVTTG